MTQAEKNPNMLLIGTITGVFRSNDSGETWFPLPTIPKAGNEVDVESLAIDPRNSDVIYAGTWYLPYKSSDGGQSWKVIKNGIIDDSDIFAINIDPRNADHVIASACSGIYETRNARVRIGRRFRVPSQLSDARAHFAASDDTGWRLPND